MLLSGLFWTNGWMVGWSVGRFTADATGLRLGIWILASLADV